MGSFGGVQDVILSELFVRQCRLFVRQGTRLVALAAGALRRQQPRSLLEDGVLKAAHRLDEGLHLVQAHLRTASFTDL